MNRRLGAGLTLLALVWLWLVDNYIPPVATEGAPGPRAFPFLLGVILAILGVALAIQPDDAGRVPPRTDDMRPQADPPNTRIAITTFALLIAYAFLLDKAGFVLSTIALIVLTMTVLLGIRRWLFVASLAVGFTFGCWVVFVSLLGVPLPGGSWMP